MDFLDHAFDWLDGTWIGGLIEWIAGHAWLAIPIALLVGLAIAIYTGVMFVARGGGQYGIIEGYVGTIGAGKTTLAVQQALLWSRARKAVLLSNIPVVCGPGCKEDRHEIEHELLPMTDDGIDLGVLTRRAFELRDQERGLVLLMDEVGVVMPSRAWKDFSVALMWVLQQSRKLACEWIWTAQDASFVDHQLRTLTSVVHHVRSYPPPSIWRRAKGKRPWFLMASTYTPSAAPRANGEATGSERAMRDRRIGRRIWRYRRRWESAFDTDGIVLPSKHLKGAEVLVSAVEALGDRHVIKSAVSDFGERTPGVDPELEPEAA